MKCEICNKVIQTMYLGKVLGTVIKDEKGKKHWICDECQKKYKSKKELLTNLK